VVCGIPPAITGLYFWKIQNTIARRDAKRDKQEEAKREHELLLIEAVCASIALGEATAQSVRRLDSNCNGDMTEALKYAKAVKHKQKDFLARQGVENLV